MHCDIVSKDFKVTGTIKNYVDQHLVQKLQKQNESNEGKITLTLEKEDDFFKVKASVNGIHKVMLSEETHKDLYAAINNVSSSLSRQFRKEKTSILSKRNKVSPMKM